MWHLRTLLVEELEDTKGEIRINKLMQDKQHNGQKKKYKRTNNDLQNTTQKTKYRVTRTLLKTGGELRCSGRVSSSFPTNGTHRVNLVTKIKKLSQSESFIGPSSHVEYPNETKIR